MMGRIWYVFRSCLFFFFLSLNILFDINELNGNSWKWRINHTVNYEDEDWIFQIGQWKRMKMLHVHTIPNKNLIIIPLKKFLLVIWAECTVLFAPHEGYPYEICLGKRMIWIGNVNIVRLLCNVARAGWIDDTVEHGPEKMVGEIKLRVWWRPNNTACMSVPVRQAQLHSEPTHTECAKNR